ncbi:MAG: hypothetical protein RR313_00270 [Anaerovoracaceae bacterium]
MKTQETLEIQQRVNKLLNGVETELLSNRLSQSRVLELKELTMVLGRDLDESMGFSGALASAIQEVYKTDNRYPKRKVKKAIKMLGIYVNG